MSAVTWIELGTSVRFVLRDGRAYDVAEEWRLAVETGYEGPPVLVCAGAPLAPPDPRGSAAKDYRRWTRGHYPASTRCRAYVAEGDGEDLGHCAQVEYDGLLAGREVRRYHPFGAPYPVLVLAEDGPRFEPREWCGRVTPNGIEG